MPFVVVLIRLTHRVLRALDATQKLLVDAEARRAFPWPYLRRLPRESPAAGVLMLTLAGSLLTALAAVAVPQHQAGHDLAVIAMATAAAGIASGWLRQLRLWWRIRR